MADCWRVRWKWMLSCFYCCRWVWLARTDRVKGFMQRSGLSPLGLTHVDRPPQSRFCGLTRLSPLDYNTCRRARFDLSRPDTSQDLCCRFGFFACLSLTKFDQVARHASVTWGRDLNHHRGMHPPKNIKRPCGFWWRIGGMCIVLLGWVLLQYFYI